MRYLVEHKKRNSISTSDHYYRNAITTEPLSTKLLVFLCVFSLVFLPFMEILNITVNERYQFFSVLVDNIHENWIENCKA